MIETKNIETMRNLLSVIDFSNETENNEQMMLNSTLYDNDTDNVLTTEECGVWNEEYEVINSTIQWWCEGALFSVVGLIGLVVNIISVGILCTKELRKHTFNQLLIAHCLVDIGFIIVSVPVYTYNLVFTVDTTTMHGQIFIQLYVTALYPLSAVMLCASVYMTVAITIERYLAVCRPIFYRNLTRTMTSARRVALYVTPVLLVSSCLNIPKFMETQTSSGSSDEQTNGTSSDNTTEAIKVQAADIRLDPTYMLYYTISQIFHPTLTTGIAPMVALIFMNTSIFFGIRKTVAARNQRRAPPPTVNLQTNGLRAASQTHLAANQRDAHDERGSCNNIPQNNRQSAASALAINTQRPGGVRDNRKTETNLAVVLIGITTMHLVCHSLRVFLATYAVYLNTTWVNCMKTVNAYLPPLWTMCAEHISSIMIMVNLAGNFLIYCSVLKPFKAYLMECCGLSVWLKLFRRFTEFANSLGRTDEEVDNAQAGILITIPPPNPIEHEVDNGDAINNPVFTTNTVLNISPNLQENSSNGVANTVEMEPMLTSQVESNPSNEPSGSDEKPTASRPRGFGSSMRLDKKKIFAKHGRGLSFLSHFRRKSNAGGLEENLRQCNGNRKDSIKSNDDKNVGTNNISSSGKKCTLVSGNDTCVREEGTQQLLVESEGGTVLFESTNVTMMTTNQTSLTPCHLYENQSCGKIVDECSPTIPVSPNQAAKANKRDGFSQT